MHGLPERYPAGRACDPGPRRGLAPRRNDSAERAISSRRRPRRGFTWQGRPQALFARAAVAELVFWSMMAGSRTAPAEFAAQRGPFSARSGSATASTRQERRLSAHQGSTKFRPRTTRRRGGAERRQIMISEHLTSRSASEKRCVNRPALAGVSL